MRHILASLLLLILSGCGAVPIAPVTVPESLPLSIIVYPQLVRVYSTFRFTCLLPDEAEGAVVYGIQGLFHSEHKPLDRKAYSRIVTIGCDEMQLYCGYLSPGATKPKMITQTLTPIGECR
jgi:hypothetical protein